MQYLSMVLFGALLALAGTVEGKGKKDKTLDPETCQEAGTCWIPAGGDPQPVLKKVEKDTFNHGYTSGRKFLVPGEDPKFTNHLLWMVIIEEWYGPWCLYYLNERSYYKCLQGIVFESRGNAYGCTDSTTWIEMGLTSVHPNFAEEHNFEVCGDPEIAIWAASRENHGRRESLVTAESWGWLDGHSRRQKEMWLGATGSLNANAVLYMAKEANADGVTPEMVEQKKITPFKRLVGALRKWDKTGAIYLKKKGIGVTPWFIGFRLGRGEAQKIRYPMISWRPGEVVMVKVSKKVAKALGIQAGSQDIALEGRTIFELAEEYDTTVVDIASYNVVLGGGGMCYGSEVFYEPGIMKPMPAPKSPFPGHNNFGKPCKKYKKQWRQKIGKSLATAVRRGTPVFKELQEQGYFPPDELYEWWEATIGDCRVSESPLIQGQFSKLNEKNPPGY